MPSIAQAFRYSLDDIRHWGDPACYQSGERAARGGYVVKADYDPATRTGTGVVNVNGTLIKAGFTVRKGTHLVIDNKCECEASRRGFVCTHTMAVALTLAFRAEAAARPEMRADERAHAERTDANLRAGRSVVRNLESGTAAALLFSVPQDWVPRFRAEQAVPLSVSLIPAGATPLPPANIRPVPIQNLVRSRQPIRLEEQDDTALYILEDIAEGDLMRPLVLSAPYFLWILDFLGRLGRPLFCEGAPPISVRPASEACESHILSSLDHETGELLLTLNTDIPGLGEGIRPEYIFAGNAGYAFVRKTRTLWPLRRVLPPLYQRLYADTQAIPRLGTRNFLEHELENLRKSFRVEVEYDPALFTWTPAEPTFVLSASIPESARPPAGGWAPTPGGLPPELAFRLLAVYAPLRDKPDVRIPVDANAPASDFSIPDPADPYACFVRNLPAEQAALEALTPFGFRGLNGERTGESMRGNALAALSGEDAVLTFFASGKPGVEAMPGWSVEFEGPLKKLYESIERIGMQVSIDVSGGLRATFDMDCAFKTLRRKHFVPRREIAEAIAQGKPYLVDYGPRVKTPAHKPAGPRIQIFDPEIVKTVSELESECHAVRDPQEVGGGARFGAASAPFVLGRLLRLKSSGVLFDDASMPWVRRNQEFLRGGGAREDRSLIPQPLQKVLRPYQVNGVLWLRWIERGSFGGILADEMGLGKTLQTLAWLSMERVRPESRGLPALVVCPTSLVQNWEHEAACFTPWLKTLVISGADRHELFGEIPKHDLVITSYALLRRDMEAYGQHAFSVCVLDEAQNIKNRDTRNAQTVKQVAAHIRLAITGTPIENSLADLWSIFDFLMPGYLAEYEDFRAAYEIPISLRTSDAAQPADIRDGERCLARLRDKIRPFLLRRLKTAVARDLPAKIVQVSWTAMSPDQMEVYRGLRDRIGEQISNAVAAQGLERSRMLILTGLLRLRQAACHLALLGEHNPKPDAAEPSGKLAQLLELLEDAASEGHRILVFSQFVEMLHLIRDALDARKCPYCYLDGSSTDRLETVHRFNADPSIPVFLISLKAGGTGLNLTGADEVVLFDPWWNPAIEQQAIDRAHRIGQKRTVHALKLITPGTVEEKVLEMQRRKSAIIDATISASDAQTVASLSWDDVKSLFELR